MSNSSKQGPYDEKKAIEETLGEPNIPEINKVIDIRITNRKSSYNCNP